jgi:hypothetical protein
MTREQAEKLNLGIAPLDTKSIIIIESGIEWIKENTTLELDLEALHANVKLFLIHYFDVMSMTAGVSSESISGLSHSFDTSNKDNQIWQYAETTLGPWLKSQMTFCQAKKRW